MNVRLVLLGVLLLSWSASASAQTVKLEFRAGRVHLTAQNAPIRTILAEWARLGGTKILNGERVPGAPVTLELAGVTERQAIDILLRGAAGYIVGPRQVGSTAASGFASILILPTSTAAGRQAAAVAPAANRRGQPEPDPDSDDDSVDAPEPDERRTPAAIRQAAEAAARQRQAERRPQVFVGDQVVEQADDSQPAPAQPGSSPFVVPGAVRPGVITPAPPPPANRRRQPDQEP
jgi:hypothetical protein